MTYIKLDAKEVGGGFNPQEAEGLLSLRLQEIEQAVHARSPKLDQEYRDNNIISSCRGSYYKVIISKGLINEWVYVRTREVYNKETPEEIEYYIQKGDQVFKPTLGERETKLFTFWFNRFVKESKE